LIEANVLFLKLWHPKELSLAEKVLASIPPNIADHAYAEFQMGLKRLTYKVGNEHISKIHYTDCEKAQANQYHSALRESIPLQFP
jgi:hypothetical protein